MKKVIAINGSPRKNGNTATLLNHALEGAKSAGAETEIIHLYDLNYKGCISCFACKLKNKKLINQCSMQDELTPILEKVMKCDVLIMGSPIYVYNISGALQAFKERLEYMNLSYDLNDRNQFKGQINVGMIYTMGISIDSMIQKNMDSMFKLHAALGSSVFNGKWEYMTANQTTIFKNPSRYVISDEIEKKQNVAREIQFPIDCKNAFEMGKNLVELYK
ncbi:flavodoxin family protein [uncultured Acetobacteroides sp.]|uniref:flavodoxin family protein n=1 Tax=uncultured Acetobacteroides sp. TaxID=1760811 RepID=UPI0029F53F76|nr:flavodoxin family protein [uncultured Acetobacteroides sp.]